MKSSNPQNPSPKLTEKSSYKTLTVISTATFFFIFLISNIHLDFSPKILICVATLLAYGFFVWFLYPRQIVSADSSQTQNVRIEIAETSFDEDISNKLLALEEASQFFGASLKAGDMFRLVASRINEMIPFASCVLFLVDEKQSSLKTVFSSGENADLLTNLEIPLSGGLTGKVFDSGRCQLDKKLVLDKIVLPANSLKNLTSAIAAPLHRGSDTFAVLELFGSEEISLGESSLKLLEAIAVRFSPLLLNSLTFQESVSDVLTDSLTNLPNERAFLLVLENQIAESQRYRDERPLTILTIDIKNFAAINQKYGHATGDNMLFFASTVIKNQLRQMDFLARSAGDEFLSVLPTASEAIVQEIIERLNNTFKLNLYGISPEERILVRLNYGTATLWKDGETSQELLKTANFRRRQNKLSSDAKITYFPKS